MTTRETMQKMDDACRDARELAQKIAPHLKELEAKLEAEGTDPNTRTASYILLQAAAGFAASSDGRGPARGYLSDLADLVAGDLIEAQIY